MEEKSAFTLESYQPLSIIDLVKFIALSGGHHEFESTAGKFRLKTPSFFIDLIGLN